MRVIWWAAIAIAVVLVVLFAISNRQWVSVGLWPLVMQVEMPLYLALLLTLLLGFVIGEVVAWLAATHWRREARRARTRIAELENELASTRPRIAS